MVDCILIRLKNGQESAYYEVTQFYIFGVNFMITGKKSTYAENSIDKITMDSVETIHIKVGATPR